MFSIPIRDVSLKRTYVGAAVTLIRNVCFLYERGKICIKTRSLCSMDARNAFVNAGVTRRGTDANSHAFYLSHSALSALSSSAALFPSLSLSLVVWGIGAVVGLIWRRAKKITTRVRPSAKLNRKLLPIQTRQRLQT